MKYVKWMLIFALPLTIACDSGEGDKPTEGAKGGKADDASEGEPCAAYGQPCAEGLYCAYVCPDGGEPPCNFGFNPQGYCEAEPSEDTGPDTGGGAAEGEPCAAYGEQCAEGLVCAYECPAGQEPPCNFGINPQGHCVAEDVGAGVGEPCAAYGQQCAEGLYCEYECPGGEEPPCNFGINPQGQCQEEDPGAAEGEACAAYGEQCAEGLVCVYECPDGGEPPCNFGINPQGYCAPG
jgi:hypothetical protein